MNSQQTIEVLTLFRPGTADEHDPSFAEALDSARRSPEVSRWFEGHCAAYETMRARFKQIAVPRGLKEQILSECVIHDKVFMRGRPAVLLAAAFAIALLIIGVNWWLKPSAFEQYRNRMVGTALRTYGMDLETSDLAQIRSFLADHQGHRDFVLPPTLERTIAAGCKLVSWHNQRVSMICFTTGRPMAPGQKTDLWLFVVDDSSVPNAPADRKPVLAKISKLTTATWSQGGKTYMLAVEGNEDYARKFL